MAEEAMDIVHMVIEAYKEPAQSNLLALMPHLSPEDREQVVTELMHCGDRDTERKAHFYCFASACLEALEQPAPELQGALRERLALLVPPKKMKDARLLARAGSWALKPLERFLLSIPEADFSPDALLCLGTLFLLRSTAALDVLERVVSHHLQTPPGLHGSYYPHLEKGWEYFDQEAYARKIMAPIYRFLEAEEIVLNKHPMESFTTLGGFQHFDQRFTSLRLYNCRKLKDISALHVHQQLEKLEIVQCPLLQSLAALGSLSKLKRVYLNGCWQVSDFTPFQQATQLESLNMFECAHLTDLKWLVPLERLQWLDLLGCTRLESIAPLSSKRSLKHLSLTQLPALTRADELAALQELESLTLSECRQLEDISALASLSRLKELYLTDCTALREVHALAQLPVLEVVHLERCYQVKDEDIRSLPGLVVR